MYFVLSLCPEFVSKFHTWTIFWILLYLFKYNLSYILDFTHVHIYFKCMISVSTKMSTCMVCLLSPGNFGIAFSTLNLDRQPLLNDYPFVFNSFVHDANSNNILATENVYVYFMHMYYVCSWVRMCIQRSLICINFDHRQFQKLMLFAFS